MSEGEATPRPLTKKARRAIVEARAAGHCEYCRMVQRFQGASYHLEHVAPSSGGGGDELGNLAWACSPCNLAKSDRVRLLDPEAGELVAVYDPRSMSWGDHFAWTGCEIVGRTGVGRALIHALKLNSAHRVGIREMERDQGCFPPVASGHTSRPDIAQ